jgi:hypothetical protein
VTLLALAATLATWLAKKFLNWIDAKTKWLDDENDLLVKSRLKARIVDLVGLAVRSTGQTYVDALKDANKDHKLTKEEKGEAFRLAKKTLLALLVEEGITLGKDVTNVVLNHLIEGVVRGESEKRAARLANAAGNP